MVRPSKNTMTILITSDFYTDFELIEVESDKDAENYIQACISNTELPQVTIIGSSDNLTSDEAIERADKIIYISDYYMV